MHIKTTIEITKTTPQLIPIFELVLKEFSSASSTLIGRFGVKVIVGDLLMSISLIVGGLVGLTLELNGRMRATDRI